MAVVRKTVPQEGGSESGSTAGLEGAGRGREPRQAAAPGGWNRPGDRLSPQSLRRQPALRTRRVQPRETVSDSALQSCKVINGGCFKPPSVWKLAPATTGNECSFRSDQVHVPAEPGLHGRLLAPGPGLLLRAPLLCFLPKGGYRLWPSQLSLALFPLGAQSTNALIATPSNHSHSFIHSFFRN